MTEHVVDDDSFEPSEEQRQALEARGRVLVTAAAGSGKTGVLAGRIVLHVTEQNVPVERIAAVTFTRKAAAEIRARVAKELDKVVTRPIPDDATSAERDARNLGKQRAEAALAGLEGALFTTIDGLCAHFVRQFPRAAGVAPGFVTLSSAHVARATNRALTAALEHISGTRDGLRLRARYGDDNLAQILEQTANLLATQLDTELRFDGEHLPQDAAILDELWSVYERELLAAKHAAGGLDHPDIQRAMLRLTRDDDVVADIRHQIQRLLVDEFQDTNEVQCAIVDAVGGDELFCVGDANQSIYRFRGADVDVFTSRMDEHTLTMADNYRSDPAVIDAVNSTFGPLLADTYVNVCAKREATPAAEVPGWFHDLPDNARTATLPGAEVVMIEGKSDEGSQREARVLAARIRNLIRSGTARAGDIAVLTPKEQHVPKYEAALQDAGVPTTRASAKGFQSQQQVQDVLALLRWIGTPTDDRLTCSVLAASYIGCTARDLYELRRRAGEAPIVTVLPTSGNARAECAAALHSTLTALAAQRTLVEVVDHAVHATDHHLAILARPDGPRRYAHMRKLIELAAEAMASGVREPGAFADFVEQSSRIGEANVASDDADAVRILTIHKAKGLEYPHVFVVSTSSQSSNQKPWVYVVDGVAHFRGVDANGVTLDAPSGSRYLDAHMADLAASEQENRRLMYVALTRAKITVTVFARYEVGKRGLRTRGYSSWLLPALGVELSGERPQRGGAPNVPVTVVDMLDDVWSESFADAHDAKTQTLAPVLELPALPAPEPLRPRRVDALPGWIPLVDEHVRAVRMRGTDLHAALAVALASGPDHEPASDAVRAVTRSETFRALREAGGQPEMPIVVELDGTVRALRYDALVVLDDGTWWIVDYKSTLPIDPQETWELHGEQMTDYARAARLAGAREVRITLVPIDRPDEPVEWTDVDVREPVFSTLF